MKLQRSSDGEPAETIWFSRSGSVTHYAGYSEIHLDGLLIGRWDHGEPGQRNLMLVNLAENKVNGRVHLGNLARAFKVSPETLRVMRKQAQIEGLEAVMNRRNGGSQSKVTPELREQLESWFEGGLNPAEAHKCLEPDPPVSAVTVWRVHQAWRATQRESSSEPTRSVESSVREQTWIPGFEMPGQRVEESGTDSIGREVLLDTVESRPNHEVEAEQEADRGPVMLADAEVLGGRSIQHLGAWILIALVNHLGLHKIAAELVAGEQRQKPLRMALDAVLVAFAIGQKCVEGVRRLATPTVPLLLRVSHAPSASWVRRILYWFAEVASSAQFHLSMAEVYLAMGRGEEDEPCVFYIDNHMRPYTGKHTLRRTWRMQDKRARPGATDYYVHDEDGRPVLRIDVPQHDSLAQWLTPIAHLVRERLGTDERVLLAFDRAGAYSKEMAELRDEGLEFVTYERKPYQQLSRSAFSQSLIVGDKEVWIHESRRKNLKNNRGRVRRISVLTEEGNQVNLLAISREPAERLVTIMMLDGGRWVQENGFKHANERWGINHLDGRRIEGYPPESIIPNPARRRLERALRMARASEGAARCKLQRLPSGHKRRPTVEKQLTEAIEQQARLEAQRAHTPNHIALKDSELADTLVKHSSHYKTILDTIRIACANAESDLAHLLAPHMPRPEEAKKALHNLFTAPGDVRADDHVIRVVLKPAASHAEQLAFNAMLAELDRYQLTLPGDPRRRPLRFRAQVR